MAISSLLQAAIKRHDNGLTLHIRLTPKAAHDKITGFYHDSDGKCWLKASVTAPAESGKANAAFAKLLSKKLRLPKSSIRLIAGEQSRQKSVLIIGDYETLENHISEKLIDLGVSE